ncbi:MAG: aldose 1-epimerase family protein [Clostridia bacterium]|nr:aldose 1-epimerase family protein [Clostridia bacterium]
MIFTIENKHLKVRANTMGAQLFSLYSKDTDTEYLWQGNPVYWADRAHVLFPFIGRMYKGDYTYQGQPYRARAHGLARYNLFHMEERSATRLVFLLTESEETLQEYPFRFEFRVIFELKGKTLITRYKATNTDEKTMICAFGGHPGINVPFGEGAFEDYYLEFSEPTKAKRHLLDDNEPYMANQCVPYSLDEGKKLPLKHNLFDNDAVILSNTSRIVSVKSQSTHKFVTMHFEDFKYIGFWHAVKTDAPYVCLEPWSALPASVSGQDELQTKADMFHIPPAKSKEVSFTLEIHE